MVSWGKKIKSCVFEGIQCDDFYTQKQQIRFMRVHNDENKTRGIEPSVTENENSLNTSK